MAILSPLPLFIAVAIWAIGRLVQQKTSIGITNDSPPPDRRPLWIAAVPMFALVLVPMIIIAFSAVVQSALIPRYAISAALPLAAFVALLAKNRSATLLFLMALALSGFSVLELHSVASSRAGDLKQLADWRDETAADPAGLPIIFADRADATRLAAFAPDLAPRISIFDQRQTDISLRDFRTYELEMTGKVANFYPTPPLILPEQLAKLGQFHLIVSDPADMQNILLELPLKHDGKTIYEPLK
jgi:hypothetical protein